MLNSVDQHDLLIFEDLIDDPVVATAGRMQPFELAEEAFPESLGVLRNRAKRSSQGRIAYLLG